MKYILALALLAASADASPQTMPPLDKESSILQGFHIPGTCAFVYDDPHLFTFDQKRMDCQGEGDFILAKSYDSDFEIQGRFIKGSVKAQERVRREHPWELGTSMEAAVIKTGVPGEPVVEIDADVPGSGWQPHDCNMKYKFDGKEIDLGADEELFDGAITFQRRSAWQKSLWEDKYHTYHHRNLFFKKSGLFVQVTKLYSHDFGCYMNLRICLPDAIKKQELRGVLGNANGDPKDDLITRFGDTKYNLGWQDQNDHCVENWCVKDEADSMFGNKNINRECKAHHDAQLEEAIKNASETIKKKCRYDDDCIFDAIVTGDIEAGVRTLEDKTNKDETKPCEKKPEDEVEWDTCGVGGNKKLPCDTFVGDFKCEAVGYDFGHRMDGCDSGADGEFRDLMMTDQNPTCNVGDFNVGAFDISCSSRTGDGKFKRAMITPTVDSVVKVSGAKGGTLYTDLKAGEKYTLTTGTGQNYGVIEDIEFCFKCPTKVVDRILVNCAADVKTCPDGTELQRDASNECAFPACPAVADACALPAETQKFSVITKSWANIGAHSMYKGISIGGKLTDASPGQDATIDRTVSYVKYKNTAPNKFKFNFNGGVQFGTQGVDQKFWKKIEYITKTAKSGTKGDYKVVVVNKGGKYNLYDFRNGGQGEDNGKTLVIFNTAQTITIEKTSDGRQFGPTIIAPNAHVKVLDNAGFVDGVIIAKSLHVYGGSVQLHGDIYTGKIPCGESGFISESLEEESESDESDESEESEEGKKAPPKENKPGCAMPNKKCGGGNWDGPTTCAVGWECRSENQNWSGCKPAPQDPGTADAYAQCGGNTYRGPTTCTAGYFCEVSNAGYSGCKPETPVCPEEPVICTTDVKECADGSFVSRGGPKCEFAECPPAPPAPESPSSEEAPKPAPKKAPESPSSEEAPKPAPPAPDGPSADDRTTEKAFTKGDPHFKTFGGELYDYHGECDLVLLHNPDFKEGLGMDIHIRTKIEDFWSSVESAVIKLGEETMEIRADPGSDEWLWFNGQEATTDLVDDKWNRHHLAGFLVRYKQSNKNVREVFIHLKGSKEVLVMKTFKSFVRVDIQWQDSENYYNSVGLLGSHAHNGQRLGRGGAFIENVNAFGQEWQVRPEVDGSLFHSYEGAVVGKKCVMPPAYNEGDDLNVSSLRGRRLGASALDTGMAEKACNHLVDPEEKKACVFDVIATQDLSMASTW